MCLEMSSATAVMINISSEMDVTLSSVSEPATMAMDLQNINFSGKNKYYHCQVIKRTMAQTNKTNISLLLHKWVPDFMPEVLPRIQRKPTKNKTTVASSALICKF